MKRKIINGFRASLPKAGGLALGVMLTLPAFSVVESIELNNATLPGTVLLDNHRYVVNGTVTISASNNFATSALRVRAGTSAIIDIKKDATLNVCGGPGYGQLPGGAGIEVPSGAKLVVCGDGTLNAWGGTAADGGTGYGGMGGNNGYMVNANDLPASSLPYNISSVPGTNDVVNGVEATSFCKDAPLRYGFPGRGGAGGVGGGGAGAGIGGRGGAGGVGGFAPETPLIIKDSEYKKRTADYDSFIKFMGLAKFYRFEYAEEWPGAVEGDIGLDGESGGDGSRGLSGRMMGELIVTGTVKVNAAPGMLGAGGRNGPYGTTSRSDDKGDFDSNAMSKVNISSAAIGGAGTALGLVTGFSSVAKDAVVKVLTVTAKTASTILTAVGGVLGAVSLIESIVSIVLDANGSREIAALKWQLWMVGGGGGGGGGGGVAAIAGIGTGGAGGGGGGAGGNGFFEVGVGSVFKRDGSKPDLTLEPHHLSGHGGFGGESAFVNGRGWDANSKNGGQPEIVANDGKRDDYNASRDERFGAWSWYRSSDNWFRSGCGGMGGAAGATYTNVVSIWCSEGASVSGCKFDRRSFSGALNYEITFVDGESQHTEDFLCGRILAPIAVAAQTRQNGGATEYFNGYFTRTEGNGVQYFDCFGYPVNNPSVTTNLTLYAHWAKQNSDVHPNYSCKKITAANMDLMTYNGELADNEMYIFAENITRTSDRGPVLHLASGRAVICISDGVTLNFTGLNAKDRAGAYPAIQVDEGATLVITGTGTLYANGGNAANGEDGGLGGDAYLGTKSGTSAKEEYGGIGGTGGAGGGGAAPGIGGRGGAGGAQTSFGRTRGSATKNESDNSKGSFHTDGYDGVKGNNGAAGMGCGNVYVIGKVRVLAKSGEAGKGGAVKPSHGLGERASILYTNRYTAGGGGGGGGGAGGDSAACGIGGGGGGGGSGGTGGGGALICLSGGGSETVYGCGGGGGKKNGEDQSNVDEEYRRTKSTDLFYGMANGGAGGSGGEVGAGGGNGFLACDPNATVEMTPSRDDMSIQSAYGHPALARTIRFVSGDETVCEVLGQIGMPLPILATNIIRRTRGYVMEGAYVVSGGATNWWYGQDGEAAHDFEGYDSVTLHVSYKPDYTHLARLPDTIGYAYAATNYVAFEAQKNPGCVYVSGVTNATDAGQYSYVTALADDYTAWEDLDVTPIRTNFWSVAKVSITNEWSNNILLYDWTKTPEANDAALESDPEKTLGFKLPKDVAVDFQLGRRVGEATFSIMAHIHGGTNYVDRTLYGAYQYPSIVNLLLVSHYPWSTKVEVDYTNRDAQHDEWTDSFLEVYGDYPLIASVLVDRDNDGFSETFADIELCKVDEFISSGAVHAFKTIDLKDIASQLSFSRTNSLEIFLSVASNRFARGTVPYDMTATSVTVDGTNWPHYAVSDYRDIYPLRCSWRLVDDVEDRSENHSSVRIAIGQDGATGDWRTPYTSRNAISDYSINWNPSTAGDYVLEHEVRDSAGNRTGYRRAYFTFAPDGEGRFVTPEDMTNVVAVVLTRKASGRTLTYSSLVSALADLHSGDSLTIVGDVQLETAAIPCGTQVTVAKGGVYRDTPMADEVVPSYYAQTIAKDSNGKVTSISYELKADEVRPDFAAGPTAPACDFVYDSEGHLTGFKVRVGNAQAGLVYTMRRSYDLVNWSVTSRLLADAAGEMYITGAASGTDGFYTVTVSDDSSPALTYELNADGTATITGCIDSSGSDGCLAIPSEIDGHAVVAIADYAFTNRTDITDVDIAQSVTNIGAYAFRNCSALTAVELPTNLVTYGEDFLKGTGVKALNLPKSVTTAKVSPGLGEGGVVTVDLSAGAAWGKLPQTLEDGTRVEYREAFTCDILANGTVSLTACNLIGDGDLVIPDTIDGRLVTEIAARALCGHDEIVTLSIPSNVFLLGGYSLPTNAVTIRFAGDAPSLEGDLGLNGKRTKIIVTRGSIGWGTVPGTWQEVTTQYDE